MATRSRIAGVDGLRVAAVVGVVSIHTAGLFVYGDAGVLARLIVGGSDWAVAALFAVSGFSAHLSDVRSGFARRPFGDTVAGLARRLLVPYMFWSLFYVAWRQALGVGMPFRPSALMGAVLFGQTAWHLWFLPALFVCQLVGWYASTHRRRVLVLALAAAAFAVRLVISRDAIFAYAAFRYAAPGWLLIYSLGRWLPGTRIRVPASLVRAVALSAVVGGGLVYAFAGRGQVPIAVLTAVGALAASLVVIDLGMGRDSLRLSVLASPQRLTYGVYLTHMAFVYVLFAAQPGLLHSAGVFGLLCALGGVVALAAVSAAALRAWRVTRPIVGEY